uniref:Uncharacterized protein n=1 Tax=Anguilla anguilla TaxID=7936 RepID=A0A0E9R4S5_ANGAN
MHARAHTRSEITLYRPPVDTIGIHLCFSFF